MAKLATTERDYFREFQNLPDLVLLVEGPTMIVVDVNDHAARELGWSRDDMLGRSLSEFGDPDDRDLNPTLIERVLAGDTVHFDRRLRTADGDWRTLNFAARMLDLDQRRCLLVGRALESLALSHSRLAGLLKLADLTDDVFVVCDQAGYITYANEAAARIHGEQEFVGRHLTEFVHEDDTGYVGLLEAYNREDSRTEGRVLGRRADGSAIPFGVRTVYDRASQHWFTVERDISNDIEQERKMAQLTTDLRRRATTDALTGVANRAAWNEVLAQAVEAGEPFAVLLMDMDDFKSVNDTLGHAAGDEFLRCVAQRIQRAVKLTDVVARLGGDEFVIYLPNVGSEEAAEVADRMIEAVGQHYSINGHPLTRSCSIGVAVWEPGDDASAILRKADRAAYRAKHEGRSRFSVFS